MGLQKRFAKLHNLLRRWRWIGWAIAACLSTLLVITWAPTASGQFPALPNLIPQDIPKTPQGVKRVGVLDVTAVHFDGEEMFQIASPMVLQRENPGSLIPVEVRAKQVESNLNRVIAEDTERELTDTRNYTTVFDPQTLQVTVEQVKGQAVLMAKDVYHPQPELLITVTDSDTRYYVMSMDLLAQRWQERLQKALRSALEIRQPVVFRKQVNAAVLVGIVMLGLSLCLWLFRKLLLIPKRKLEAERAAHEQAKPELDDPQEEHHRVQFLEILQKQFSIERQLRLLGFLQWLLFWAFGAVWILGIALILQMFPTTRGFVSFLGIPIFAIAAWFLTGFANRLSDLLIDRFAKVWQTNSFIVFGNSQRKSLRVSTIVKAIRGLKTFLVYTFGILWVLQSLGVPTSSVLAFGAVLALAVSFASQNLVKDLVNGFLILLEDQYAIGDVITVGSISGLVENLNLRITQIRSADGRLITIPNSLISQVENQTRNWARVDFTITVGYATPVDHALTVLQNLAQELYQDPAWHPLILEPPQMLGVDSVSQSGMAIRVWIKTQPQEKFKVLREFNRRVCLVLALHEVEIGIPQQSTWLKSGAELLNAKEASPKDGEAPLQPLSSASMPTPASPQSPSLDTQGS